MEYKDLCQKAQKHIKNIYFKINWLEKVRKLLLVFFGCGFGGIARYLVANASYFFLSKEFPYGTIIVNISGSLAMGILYELFLGKYSAMGPELRALFLIGFLGGYTTFSSFSLETINLLENGKIFAATINVVASVITCLLAAWVGVLIGRQL